MRIGNIVVLAVLLLVCATGVPVLAAPACQAASGQAATITVTGHAEATVVPDMAVITTGIVTYDLDVESAQKKNSLTMQRLIDAMLLQGIDHDKITTTQFVLQPIYRSDDKNSGPGTITGYCLQNNITIVVEDLTKIGPVLDAAFQAGANQFQGLQFGLQDEGPLRDELLKKAALDGQHKAAIIAAAMGGQLGQPVSVSEAGQFAPVSNDGFRALSLNAGATTTPIEHGSLTYSVDLNMVYQF